MSFDHLKPAAADAVLLTPEERIDFINQDRWIGYSAAKAVLDEVADLIRHPRNLRMPCRTIIGDPDNGKSMLLKECVERYPRVDGTSDDSHLPVLVFETPSQPDEGRLYSQMLKALRVAHREDAAPERLLPKVIEQCFDLNIRVLMADEFHNMLCGTPAHQRQFLASLKSLVNTLRVSFVAAGIVDVGRALAADGQFVTRFEQLSLPRWGFNEESLRLLASLEMMVPLAEPSGFAKRELAPTILSAGGGTIGGICRVVKKSAIAAIREKEEKVTLDLVKAVVEQMRSRKLAA
jgi:hypothetical protein